MPDNRAIGKQVTLDEAVELANIARSAGDSDTARGIEEKIASATVANLDSVGITLTTRIRLEKYAK